MARANLSSSKLAVNMINSEDDEPMAPMGNLMDVMLVFACGLILALIANWGVDVSELSSFVTTDESVIEPIDAELEEVYQGISLEDSDYTELGVVYREESTGQLYVVTPG